jgi:hypothetical protein
MNNLKINKVGTSIYTVMKFGILCMEHAAQTWERRNAYINLLEISFGKWPFGRLRKRRM